MAKKHKHEEHVNHERWLVSYADFITLLFAFFVVMYAVSSVDTAKAKKFENSINVAFNMGYMGDGGFNPNFTVFPADGGTGGQGTWISIMPEQQNADIALNEEIMFPEDQAGKDEKEGEGEGDAVVPTPAPDGSDEKDPRIKEIIGTLDKLVSDKGYKAKIVVKADKEGLVISLAEAGFFQSGSAAVKVESLPILDKIAESLKNMDNMLRIEGHSDNIPIASSKYPSNWELSTARASWIVNYFVEKYAIDPFRMSAAGYGEFHPIASNETPEGRALNRRVDIIVLRKKLTGDKDKE